MTTTPQNFESVNLLRAMLQNNMQLIVIADNKASFLLGSNFIIVSACIDLLFHKGLHLYLLLFALMSSSIIIFSVLALSPFFLSQKNVPYNELFFGYVAKLPFEKYMDSFLGTLENVDAIKRMMLNDYYQTCTVLNKKFYFLKLSYRVCLLFVFYVIVTLLFFSIKPLFS